MYVRKDCTPPVCENGFLLQCAEAAMKGRTKETH